jgi:Tol biopolymer transport system component
VPIEFDATATADAIDGVDATESVDAVEAADAIEAVDVAGPRGKPDAIAPGAPDGWLAFDSDRDGARGIYLVRLDGMGLVRLSGCDTGGGLGRCEFGGDREPAFSPDGRELAYTSDVGGNPQIMILDLPTRTFRQLTSRPAGAHQPAWSRDGQWIAYVGLPYEADSGAPPPLATAAPDLFVIRPDGTGELDVRALQPMDWDPIATPAFGPDPNAVVFAVNQSIRAVGIDGSGEREIAGCPTEGTETPSVSPNGMFVAFASWAVGGEGVRFSLFVGDSKDPAHDGLSTLIAQSTIESVRSRRPSWGGGASDLVAYEIVASDRSNIAVVSPSGRGPARLVTVGRFDDRNPAWAPVGFRFSP